MSLSWNLKFKLVNIIRNKGSPENCPQGKSPPPPPRGGGGFGLGLALELGLWAIFPRTEVKKVSGFETLSIDRVFLI